MLYYSRIQSDGINPLVKEAFNINKNISNENIYTWYTFATEIFHEPLIYSRLYKYSNSLPYTKFHYYRVIFIHGTPLPQKYLKK
jgi:hypothetical protein